MTTEEKEQLTNEIDQLSSRKLTMFLNETDTYADKLNIGLEAITAVSVMIQSFNGLELEDREEILNGLENSIIKPGKNPGGSPNG